MKVLCPLCEQIINLGYLKKKGDQSAFCAKCNVTIWASFKKDKERLNWEVYFERPLSKQKPPPVGCGPRMLIAIVLLLALIAMARCDWKDLYKLGGESEEQSQN
jgi:hypothetical protein